METTEIIQRRFIAQKLTAETYEADSVALVRYFGGLQAQDKKQIEWAIGSRMITPSQNHIRQLLVDGILIRTWLMRGTIHLIASADYHWLTDLIAPRVHQICQSIRKREGLTDEVLQAAAIVLADAVKHEAKTRKQLSLALANQGLPANGIALAQLLVYASLEKLILMRGAYVFSNTAHLITNREPEPDFEASLKRLTKCYFQSHGPATLRDFIWWSGLKVADAKHGVALLREELTECAGFYMSTATTEILGKSHPQEWIPLAGFDEWIIGYQAREQVLVAPELVAEVITKNGIFRPVLLQNGVVQSTWQEQDIKNSPTWRRYQQFSVE